MHSTHIKPNMAFDNGTPLNFTLGIIKILAISGSLRAVTRLAPADISVVFYRGLGDLPLFNPDIEASDPPPVAELRTQILSAMPNSAVKRGCAKVLSPLLLRWVSQF